MALRVEELTADKGYHSNDVLTKFSDSGVRTYISEPKHGRRCWEGKTAERDVVYSDRRRVKGTKGKMPLRRHGEVLERPMAQLFNSG